jgi:hypothetical protein
MVTDELELASGELPERCEPRDKLSSAIPSQLRSSKAAEITPTRISPSKLWILALRRANSINEN